MVFRIGAHIPVPGIDPNVLADLFQGQQGGILGMFNMFSGGALSRFTIFALGIMPYISASIIMQLMSSVSPQLEALRKEGEAGRRKITLKEIGVSKGARAMIEAAGGKVELTEKNVEAKPKKEKKAKKPEAETPEEAPKA